MSIEERAAVLAGGDQNQRANDERDRTPKRRHTLQPGSNELVTEDQAAIEFAKLHAEELRYCHDTGAWFEWKGIWRRNQTGLAFHWARELARGMAITEADKIRYVTSKAAFAASIEKFARSDPVFAVTADYWDRDPFLLGTPAGAVDLRTGKLGRSDPADGITKATSVAPSDIADCPLWIRFLNEATSGDAEVIRFLCQWCGYSLSGDVSEQALVFIHGPGGTGKSLFVKIMTHILSDYVATPTMAALTTAKGERHSTDIAMLKGSRMASTSETVQGRAWDEALIKRLTGGDAITARFMRQDNFTFTPTFKLLIVGNHAPRLHNADDAMHRRFNVVPFLHKPEQPDLQLENKLRDESPAILRWAIDGCLDWLENGLIRPASVTARTDKYFADQDIWAQWLEESCDVEPGNRWLIAPSGELFQSWSGYAKAAGMDAGSRIEFAERLEQQGFVADKGTGGRRVWRCVCLRRVQERV
jgi:putative DNA primase/helicase